MSKIRSNLKIGIHREVSGMESDDLQTVVRCHKAFSIFKATSKREALSDPS